MEGSPEKSQPNKSSSLIIGRQPVIEALETGRAIDKILLQANASGDIIGKIRQLAKKQPNSGQQLELAQVVAEMLGMENTPFPGGKRAGIRMAGAHMPVLAQKGKRVVEGQQQVLPGFLQRPVPQVRQLLAFVARQDGVLAARMANRKAA